MASEAVDSRVWVAVEPGSPAPGDIAVVVHVDPADYIITPGALRVGDVRRIVTTAVESRRWVWGLEAPGTPDGVDFIHAIRWPTQSELLAYQLGRGST